MYISSCLQISGRSSSISLTSFTDINISISSSKVVTASVFLLTHSVGYQLCHLYVGIRSTNSNHSGVVAKDSDSLGC